MTPSDLTGPFPSSRDLTDYRDEPGYPIPPSDSPPVGAVSSALSRLDRALTRKAAA